MCLLFPFVFLFTVNPLLTPPPPPPPAGGLFVSNLFEEGGGLNRDGGLI